VFFNRNGKLPLTTAPLTPADAPPRPTRSDAAADARWQVAGRRAVALGMAVQLAVPVAALTAWVRPARAAAPVGGNTGGTTDAPGRSSGASFDPVGGSDAALRQLFGTAGDGTPAVPALSAAASGAGAAGFARAIDQLRAGEYEGAVATLTEAREADFGDADGARVDDTLAKSLRASRQQQKARADLLVAQQAAAAGRPVEAAVHYRSAATNLFADADTRRQAGEGALRLLGDGGTTLATPIQADVVPSNAVALAADMQQVPAAPTTAPTDPAPASSMPATAPADAAPVAGVPSAATAPAPPAPEAQPVAPAVPVAATPAPAPAVVAAPPAVPMAAPADEQSAAQAALSGAANYQKIKLQLQQYQAKKLVDKARGEYAANQKHDALADYSEAARLDPDNQQAASGRDETAAELGLGQTATIVKSQDEVTVRIENIRYQFNSDIQRADENIAAGKFADAQQDIDKARVARNQDPTLFTTPQLNEFDTTISNTEVSLKTAQDVHSKDEADRANAKTGDAEAARQAAYERDKQRTVESLIQSARQYQEQGQYRQALAAIDQIERVDPSNQYALGTRQLVLDKATAQEQREYQERFDREFEKVLNAADEKRIPYSDIVHYSDDWPTLSEQRDQEVKADRGEGDEDQALQAQLDRHLPEVRFNANALSDVIDFLRDVSGANIYVDWKALEAASIARDAPVTAKLRDIKFSKALELIFKSVEGDDDDHKLGYTVDEGVITISTRKELNKNTVTRRYDINDLLFVAPDYNNAPSLDISSAGQGQSAGGGGGGGSSSQNLFSGGTNTQDTANNNNREQRIDEIKQYIQQNVDPNSWKDSGGDVGSVSSSPLRAILLITQTPENQHKIVSVLDSLRASQALQVSIETRFLTVQRNFLEDIGVNASMTFNPLTNPANPRSGYNTSQFSPISITQSQVTNNTTFTDANGNVVANSASGSRTLDWASSVGNSSVPGSIPSDPADYPNPIVIQGSYIDNLTVSFLIRAVEANQQSTTLTAPRLTLFSGQRSVLIVETQQAYVSDVTPVVAPGAALFNPTVSTTVATGVVLSVQATVSPDRKYVFLDLQPQLARLRALTSFTISAVITPVTTTTAGVANTAPEVVSGTLQLPTIDVTQVRTSVSVPDGATLLLGGETLAGDTTREQGVPVLSKIPFIKRLFTNRAEAQDEQILLILVKPTILIQREQEQKQFPQLSSKLTGTGT
jgi:type II secretory pathway component GspD/PulD (secretin)/tetratricopeptide (TPR) repeat protein